MDNFNKKKICYCQFCNKTCTSKNSLVQHEIRCQKNPNRIKVNAGGWGWSTRKCSSTKGKIWIHKNNDEKIVFQNEYETVYKQSGWELGLSMVHRSKSIGNSGVGGNEDIERERRRKISCTMKKNPNAGGYRKGSGRGHKGWYQNIFCDSSWELAFVVYHIEHDLFIKRCTEKRKYIYNNEIHTYLPDFVTSNGIFEIKGYNTLESMEKQKQNADVKFLYENDMKVYLDYTMQKYGKEFWKVLYE